LATAFAFALPFFVPAAFLAVVERFAGPVFLLAIQCTV
jgi:hypothetical protein